MPYCPTCRTEYVAGVQNCADCGTPLVAALPDEEPASYERCPNCREEVTEDSDFCPHCGILLTDDHVTCSVHPERNAVAVCIVCRRLLCSDCRVVKKKRSFCSDHEMVEVSEDWALIFESNDYFEANLAKAKLESGNVTISVLNDLSIGYVGFLETRIGRTNLDHPIKIFVPLDRYLDAEKVLAASPEESPETPE